MDIETCFTDIIGNYKILNKIDEGGMGTVFKAFHIHMNRMVAIKVLSNQKFNDKFKKEIEITSQLNHPNIVKIHDAGTHCGFSYLVMEFVEGQNIKQLIEKGIKFTYCDFLKIVEIVDFLHKNQIIHRDIKPQNIIFNNGEAKLLDLGLAKKFDEDIPSEEGKIFGSPYWMAPEQAMNSNDVDYHADIYSLGCLWYYMMTGQEVFKRNGQIPVILSHQEEKPPKFPIQKYDKFFQKMLEKNPEDRLELKELFRKPSKFGVIAACFILFFVLIGAENELTKKHIEYVQPSQKLDYPFIPQNKHNREMSSSYPFKRSKKHDF